MYKLYCDLSKFLINIALTKRHVVFTKRLNKMINSNPKFKVPPHSGDINETSEYSILQALFCKVDLANIFPIKFLLFVLLIINEYDQI